MVVSTAKGKGLEDTVLPPCIGNSPFSHAVSGAPVGSPFTLGVAMTISNAIHITKCAYKCNDKYIIHNYILSLKAAYTAHHFYVASYFK